MLLSCGLSSSKLPENVKVNSSTDCFKGREVFQAAKRCCHHVIFKEGTAWRGDMQREHRRELLY